MQLEVLQIDELAAVTPRDILRPLQVSNRIPRRADRPAVPAVYEQRFFIGCRHFMYQSILSFRTGAESPARKLFFLCAKTQCTPNVKIGRYNEISTPPTKIAITIRIRGSISAMDAPRAVCTSSS